MVLPAVAAITPYEPGKPTEELERELGIQESVKLASNENPIGPSPKAVQAIRAALSELNRYPDGGSFTLCHKIAARHKVSPAQIFMGSGSCEIINLLAFLVKGGSQQIVGHVHEQAEVAGGVLAERLQKRRVHELGITGHLEQVVQTLEQLGRGQGFGAQSRPDAAGDG